MAMFDIRPTEGTEGFGFGEIDPEVNLRKQTDKLQPKPSKIEQKKPIPEYPNPKTTSELVGSRFQSRNTKYVPKVEIDEDLFYKLPKPSSKKYILEELERVLAEPVNAVAHLASYGARVHENNNPKPRTKITRPSKIIKKEVFEKTRPDQATQNLEEFWSAGETAPDIQEPEVQLASVQESEIRHSPASREIEVWLAQHLLLDRASRNLVADMSKKGPGLENLKKNQQFTNQQLPPQKIQRKNQWLRILPRFNSWFKRNRYYSIIFLAIGGLAFNFVYDNGIGARKNIVQNGGNAVANLEEAKKDLEEFKFIEAADRFALAYDDFNRASGTLSQMGASFISIFGNLPGLNKIRAASNLVEAGQSISKAGENLSLAFGTLYKTNLLSFLDSNGGGSSKSISKILTEFRDVLVFAEKNIARADKLLAEIDSSVLPPDKQPMFSDFKEKIPDFQKYIGDAVDYSEFLLDVVGGSGAKTYLVLLQNNSELRPTGGFPGTYAVVTFEDGVLKKIFVDDVYRLDAALKENIIPPKPIQHITPNWGLRDAAWWADFPTSARKISGFYKLDTSGEIDGVLTVTPTVIEKIFNVIGPIEMPEYGTTLGADNFLHEIQNEVEYEADRSAPKQIVSDLQPLFFERLSQQDKSKWVEIFKVLLEAAEQKHILAYFDNDKLEEVAIKNGLGGETKIPVGDYLQVAFSNVKGSKTDFVTDNTLNLDVAHRDDGAIDHVLKITRTHNGGNSKYGFYNRDNSAYIKVYVPLGSRLGSIQGNSITDYKPLIGHVDFGFKKDPDLARIENSTRHPFPDVDVFEESGKTVFGFWLITKPGTTKSVAIGYQVPSASVCACPHTNFGCGGESANVCDNYKLYWQKQSGTIDDRINFSFALPEGKQPVNQSEGLQLLGNNLVLNSDLSVDREVDIRLK